MAEFSFLSELSL